MILLFLLCTFFAYGCENYSPNNPDYVLYYHLRHDCELMAQEYLYNHGVLDAGFRNQIRKYLMSYHYPVAGKLLAEIERENFQFLEPKTND